MFQSVSLFIPPPLIHSCSKDKVLEGICMVALMGCQWQDIITIDAYIKRLVISKDMVGDDHLHIDKDDQIVNWLIKSMKAAKEGIIKIYIKDQSAAQINLNDNLITVDLLQPEFFRTSEEIGLFDKLKTAKEFAQKLTDNGLTISFLRKGKDAISLGKDAKPTLSRLITRSDDIQIDSVKEITNLKRDLKDD